MSGFSDRPAISSPQQPPAGSTPPPDPGGKRTAWQVASTVPPRRRNIQFGMWTMLVILSVGGPICAAAMLLPPEFYKLNAFMIASVTGAFVLAFGLSFCRPRWAFFIFAAAVLFVLFAHLAVFTNRFHLDDHQNAILLTLAWATMIVTGGGFILSYSRHDQ